MATKKSRSKKRDRVWLRKNSDGSVSFIGVVRVKGFDPAYKTFTTNRADARAWADSLVRELHAKRKSGDARKDITSLTIKGLIEDYLEDYETKKLRTFADIQRLLGWWVNHFGAEKVFEVGPVKLRAARGLLHKGRAEGTVNRYLGALRSCWSWGKAAGYISADKVWPTRLFLSEPRERVRFLSDSELRAVLDAAEAHSSMMHAAVVVSLATGLRQGELLRLTWAGIDLAKQTLTVHISKNTKRRLVHLPGPAIDALKKLRGVGLRPVFLQPDGEPVDKSQLRVQWLKIRAEARLCDFHWHDLRHSCASFLAQAGASLPEIGHVLGHSSPSITAKYSHLIAGAPVTGSAALAAKLGAKL